MLRTLKLHLLIAFIIITILFLIIQVGKDQILTGLPHTLFNLEE